MASWLSRARVMIRDEGEPAYKGARYKKDEKDENGQIIHHKDDLILDTSYPFEPVDPPRPARNRWPDHTGVYVRPRMTGADLQMINKLGRRADALLREVKADDLEGLHNDLEAIEPAIIQLSVLVTGFECRIAKREDCASDEEFEECNIFEDPRTRPDYKSQDDEGTEGTGTMLAMPEDTIERIKTIALLPADIIGRIAAEYSNRQGNPMPGTKAVA